MFSSHKIYLFAFAIMLTIQTSIICEPANSFYYAILIIRQRSVYNSTFKTFNRSSSSSCSSSSCSSSSCSSSSYNSNMSSSSSRSSWTTGSWRTKRRW